MKVAGTVRAFSMVIHLSATTVLFVMSMIEFEHP